MSLKDIFLLIFCGTLVSFQFVLCLLGEIRHWMKRSSDRAIELVTISISVVLGFLCTYFWISDISAPAVIIFLVVVFVFFKSSFSNYNEHGR